MKFPAVKFKPGDKSYQGDKLYGELHIVSLEFKEVNGTSHSQPRQMAAV